MDLLDILEGRYNQTFAGRYYSKLPTPKTNVSQPGPAYFDYSHVDPTEYHYTQLLGNLLLTDAANCTIKTKSPIDFAINKHVALQDGKLYLVCSITVDNARSAKEAARLRIFPVGTEKVLRLKEVEDPWGIGGLSDE